MEKIAGTISASNDRLGSALSSSLQDLRSVISRQARKLDEVLLTSAVLDRVERARRKGDTLDESAIESVVRSVIKERKDQD